MRAPIRIWVREGDKLVGADAILWINELPPELRRGKNRKMKNRKGKRVKQAAIVVRRDELAGGGLGVGRNQSARPVPHLMIARPL